MTQQHSESHYNHDYFSWQKNIGSFGGWANLTKFSDYIKPSDKVLDFGCGGGYLLANIICAERMGIEINSTARKNAERIGITTYENIEEISDKWADVIISNHALEHVQSPFETLSRLIHKLRHGGLAIFVVPCESYKIRYKPDDINQHLFTWSPMNLGNIFSNVGFKVIKSEVYLHKWPPYYQRVAKISGRNGFEFVCRIYGWLKRDITQIRIIAQRP